MRLFKSIALSLSVLFSSNTFAQKVEADQILGTYVLESIITDDIGHVLITKAKDGSYQGRLVWVNHPTNADGSVRCDDNNPDPQLRKRRYDQVYIFRNLKFKKDEWVNGKLYDPFSSKCSASSSNSPKMAPTSKPATTKAPQPWALQNLGRSCDLNLN